MHRIIQPEAVEGEESIICAAVPPVKEDINEVVKPVIRRKGSVITNASRSFRPGLTIQSSIFHDLTMRYQIRASEGTLCRKNLIISAVTENSLGVAVPLIAPAEPDKKRTIYKMRASIYIPIIIFLYYNYILEIDHVKMG
jgi:hypothetical protein